MQAQVLLVFALILVCALVPTDAWWCTSHMIVAGIAREYLNLRAPTVIPVVNDLLYIQGQYTPKSNEWLTASCWSDDIKAFSRVESSWHFVNYPVMGDLPPSQAIPQNDGKYSNCITILSGINSTYTGYSDRVTPNESSRLMHWLFHLIGDLHQPLHNSNMYSAQYDAPSGDLGGNKYSIKYPSMTNLHQLYDSVGGLYTANYKRPLSDTNYQNVMDAVHLLMKEYPLAKLPEFQTNTTFLSWSRESWLISNHVAYLTKQYTAPTEDYIEQVRDILKQRVAVAGYRLGYLLEQYFSPNVTRVLQPPTFGQCGDHESHLPHF